MYVIVTCDHNPKFLNFLPTISYHWRSLGHQLVFGLVSREPISEDEIARIKTHCDFFHLEINQSTYSDVCMAKMYRFFLSREYSDKVVCIQDIE